MLAGRPHEAVGNGSPRWMTAAPRERGTEPGLQAPPFVSVTSDGMVTTFPHSGPVINRVWRSPDCAWPRPYIPGRSPETRVHTRGDFPVDSLQERLHHRVAWPATARPT